MLGPKTPEPHGAPGPEGVPPRATGGAAGSGGGPPAAASAEGTAPGANAGLGDGAIDDAIAGTAGRTAATSPGDGVPLRGREIDPRVLAEIGSLTFRARVVAESASAGMHRSRNHGTSAEFADHKEYSPGDNLKQLDWRAFARNDRDYIKRFENESNLRALALIDTSASMGYPSGERARLRLTKLAYATTCAGALAYVLARQGDAVGIAAFSEKLQMLVPSRARRGHLKEVLGTLEGLHANGPSRLGAALDALSEAMPRRMVITVFTDLLDGGLDALEAVKRLRARQHDIVLFHVLDPDELDFPFEDSTLFVGMEGEEQINVDAPAIREAYLEEVARFTGRAEQICRAARVEYNLIRTDVSPSRLLASFLARRANLRGTVR